MQCQKLKTYMETGRVVFLPAKAIRPNPNQPRQEFSQEALEELSLSIREHGILQPLSVRRVGNQYELIAGERRLRAGIRAGLTEIPCIVMTMDQSQSAMAALIENLQRQDLDYIEQAKGLSSLMSNFCLSQEQAARVVGLSQSNVANKLRLLRHSFPVLELLRRYGLTERHARALLKLPGEEQKLAAIEVIAARGLNVAQTEAYIEKLLQGQPEKPQRIKLGQLLKTLEGNLAKIQQSGLCAVSQRRETEKEIVFTVTIPKT
ncbi:MAG: ParB/RepB/Spo0J family partition protein [Oscillospiraceae bacterium]|nr:ParB/RepB/Spo0J family partition protein [Oscillospiraceae bacterium]